MATPIIKLKKKPKKPTPKKIKTLRYYFPNDTVSFQDLIDKFREPSLTAKDIKIVDGHAYYALLPESDEAFSIRMAKYEKSLASWQKWYDKNKKKVDKEVARQAKELSKKQEKEMQELKETFL